MSNSVRHQISFNESMKRLRGEIERMVDAAEIACDNHRGCDFNRDCICPFNDKNEPMCKLEAIRQALGDHTEQHTPQQIKICPQQGLENTCTAPGKCDHQIPTKNYLDDQPIRCGLETAALEAAEYYDKEDAASVGQ